MFKTILDNTMKEIRDDYMVCLKKSLVDYVLRDPSQKEALISIITPVVSEMKQQSIVEDWARFMRLNHKKLKYKLQLYHPLIVWLHGYWYQNFRYDFK